AYPDTFKAVITWSGATSLAGNTLFPEGFDAAYAAAKKDGSYTMKFDWRGDLSLGARWFEEVKSTDVLKETAKIKAPVLAINGDKDTVVPMDNAAAIKKAAQNGMAWIVDGADHTYNIFTGDKSAITQTVNVGIGFLEEHLNGRLASAEITSVSKYGNVTTNLPMDVLSGAGYQAGDILSITVGGKTIQAPLGDAYSNVDTGKEIILPDSATKTVSVAINMGNFAGTYGVAAGDKLTFAMSEKAGYLDEYNIRNIDARRTNVRADYESDEVFANFRPVVMGGIREGILYRSSSPVNPELGRNTYADALAKKAGIATVINLADDEAGMKAYPGYADSYYATLDVIPLNMGVDFKAADFNAKLKTGLEFMIAKEGPYLIHCNEGKDRAGFTAMLLEALAGGKLDEIKADYMLSYINYYHVEKDSTQYNKIAESNVLANLRMMAGLEAGADLSKVDLAKAAADYLVKTVGLTADQVTALKTALTAPAAEQKAA
ncbi:MAG: hypothetical protein EOM52_11325, partial [Clostridia bacterium]|nr:hypothetical protein [Clostridia bacterium]